MTLSIIVATDLNRGIGKDNQLLWHLSADLKYFKAVTLGKPIIMGRKTFESIGKPLPGRRNIVISRSVNTIPGVEVCENIHDAIALVEDEAEVFIIGGAEIYRQTIGLADKIYLTQVFESFDADVFFPEIDHKKWEEMGKGEMQNDEKSGLNFCFITYVTK
jgi:dihydrofolate reductase